MTDAVNPRMSVRSRRATPFAAVALVLLMALPGATLLGAVASASPAAPAPHAVAFPAAPAAAVTTSVPTHNLGASYLATHGLTGLLRPIPSALLTGASHPAPQAVRQALGAITPAFGSTDSNWYVNGSECSQAYNLIQVGKNPDDLLQAVRSEYGEFNGTWAGSGNYATPCSVAGPNGATYRYEPSPFFNATGTAEVARSTDGGKSWTDSWLGNNTTYWTSPYLPNGELNNNSFATGMGGLAENASGSTVMFATTFESRCLNILYLFWLGYGQIFCDATTLNKTVEGVAVSTSTDGGVSWNQPAQVSSTTLANEALFKYLNCPSIGSGYGIANVTENPTISIDQSTGAATVVWTDLDIVWNTLNCSGSLGGINTYRSVSTDGGKHWGTPTLLWSSQLGETPASTSGPSGSQVVVGVDWAAKNGTSGNGQYSQSLQFSRSTNGGASWSTTDIAKDSVDLIWNPPTSTDLSSSYFGLQGQEGFASAFESSFGVAPGGSPSPVVAIDNWSTSSYENNIYVAWDDNGTGGDQGYPGIDVIASSNNGASFGSVHAIFNATHALTFWDPQVSVDPQGRVWVTFLGFASSGTYNEYGVVSTNGGSSWSSVFPISDAPSFPGSSAEGGLIYLGGPFGLLSTTDGTFASWTDCRLSNCTSTFDSQVFLSQLFADTISTNATEINATVTTYGHTSVVPVLDGSPVTFGWANGANHTVTVPQYVPIPHSTSIDSFVGYQGLSTASGLTTTFMTTVGTGDLSANYSAVQAGVLAGTFAPYVSGAQVWIYTPSTGTNVSVPLTASTPGNATYTYAVPGAGSYDIYGTIAGPLAPKYVSVKYTSVGAVSGQTTTRNFDLNRTTGSITGSVSLPDGALLSQTSVTINGTQVTLGPSGLYDVAEFWGYYYVAASNPSASSFSEWVNVTPGAPTPAGISLVGGWIQGSVVASKTSGVVVTLNGSSANISVNSAGDYNISGSNNNGHAAGWYWLNATEQGFNTTSVYVHIVPGQGQIINLDLTNFGWISGTIGPSAVLTNAHSDGLTVTATNTTTGVVYATPTIDATTGVFNMTVKGDLTYTLVVSATGYITNVTTDVTVEPGRASAFLAIVLKAKTTQVQNCSTNQSLCPPATKQNSSGSSFPLGLLVGIVLVIVVIAALAVVLLMRRRGGAGGASYDQTPAEGDSGTYGTNADGSPSGMPPSQSWNEDSPGNPPA